MLGTALLPEPKITGAIDAAMVLTQVAHVHRVHPSRGFLPIPLRLPGSPAHHTMPHTAIAHAKALALPAYVCPQRLQLAQTTTNVSHRVHGQKAFCAWPWAVQDGPVRHVTPHCVHEYGAGELPPQSAHAPVRSSHARPPAYELRS